MVREKTKPCFGYFSQVIPSYENKETFGDADYVYDLELPFNVLTSFFGMEYVRNGTITSFAVPMGDGRKFQLDMIGVNGGIAHFAYNYFSFNDLGNLVGRIVHKLGFKYGYNGLWYVLRDPENPVHVVKEILVTDNWNDFMRLFGFPIKRNFPTLESIFEYVASLPWFDPDIYLFQNLNHINRIRDRKRKTYNQFLAWLNNNKPLKKFDWDMEAGRKEEIREMYLDIALNRFTKFKKDYEETKNEFEMEKLFRMRFNGEIVRNITGLDGRELGKFMERIRNDFPNIGKLSADEIGTLIAIYYNNLAFGGEAS
jgi:hypothetical protein